jgi:hypothetical protein
MSGGECTPIEWAKSREARFAEFAAKEAAMRERTLAKLLGGLWHTTHPDRFKRVLTARGKRSFRFGKSGVHPFGSR